MMIMNLTCPECGNKFQIEESHQAKERQAAALKEQKEETEKETQRLLAEQKQQLAKEIEENHQAKIRQAVEKELNESRKQLQDEAKEEAEKETQRLLDQQRQQLAKKQDSIVEAAVQKQVKEKQVAALKEQQENLQQQTQEKLAKKDRESENREQVLKSQHKLEKDRMAVQINELQARMNRDQAVELVGEAAEVRLKADLKIKARVGRIWLAFL